MNIYTKLSLLCISLVVFTSSVFYFYVNNALERTIKKSLLSNTSDPYLPLEDLQSEFLIVVLVILGVSLLFSLLAAHMFVRPIVRLTNQAEKVANGTLGAEIKISSNDEIGKLASMLAKASQVLIARLDVQKNLNDELNEKKDKMESQALQLAQANKQVSDSLMYAQKIQQSILPAPSSISKLVKDLFIFYAPKDVVSGDFYWFERVRMGRNEYLVIVCADCTGHGVPGAIMSIMGSNQLTNIIYYQNYIDPNKILARLDKVIKFELQSENDNNRDGMEMGLCVIDLDTLKMEFAGAGIPLMLLKNGTDELITYKSPKYMIGGIEGDEKEVSEKLTKVEIQLEEGDKLYMASDGFQDQFGGENDKKFMSKKFKALINENASLPMQEQRQKLEEAFENWRGETPQTDDVVVFGIEI
ncbi:MAG: SpoIIE family protein phosphatase [Cyclobacteriaceae bacterium]